MFYRLDGILLGATQWFCDRTQRLTGLTKFSLEKWTYIMSAIFFCAGFVFKGDPIMALMILVYAVIMAGGVCVTERREKEFLNNGNILLSDWNNAHMRILAIFFCGFMAFVFTLPSAGKDEFLRSMFQFRWGVPICIILNVYFSACIPRPPAKSRVRQWCEKGLRWLRDKLQPTSIPVPIPSR